MSKSKQRFRKGISLSFRKSLVLISKVYFQFKKLLRLVVVGLMSPSNRSDFLNRSRHYENFPLPYYEWKSIEAINLSNWRRPKSFTVWNSGLPIDCRLDSFESSPLVVILNGASSRKVRLPWFAGKQVTQDLSCSVLAVSDPTLYLDPSLNLGWYAGNHLQPDLVKQLARLIEKVSDSLDSTRIILLGGSGGGFAALSLSTILRDCDVIAFNPQTCITRYHANHINSYINLAWNGSKESMLNNTRFDLVKVFKEEKPNANVFYIQNTSDDFHLQGHLKPFLSVNPKTAFFLLNDWGDGHTPPPKSIIHDILRAVIENDSQKLLSMGFKRKPTIDQSNNRTH